MMNIFSGLEINLIFIKLKHWAIAFNSLVYIYLMIMVIVLKTKCTLRIIK